MRTWQKTSSPGRSVGCKWQCVLIFYSQKFTKKHIQCTVMREQVLHSQLRCQSIVLFYIVFPILIFYYFVISIKHRNNIMQKICCPVVGQYFAWVFRARLLLFDLLRHRYLTCNKNLVQDTPTRKWKINTNKRGERTLIRDQRVIHLKFKADQAKICGEEGVLKEKAFHLCWHFWHVPLWSSWYRRPCFRM